MSGALTVRGLHAARGSKAVLRGVDLDVAPGRDRGADGRVRRGEVHRAARRGGAGAVHGGRRCEVGGFALRPGPLPRESRLRGLRSKVGMVFQAHALFPHLTALENVTLAPVHALGWTAQKAEAVAMELLDGLGVAARAGAYPRELSGGEAQRVAIARALAPDPMVLLMDEPTSALDPARRGALGETLRGLARQGRGLLIATHDVDFARAHADRVVVLHEGVMVESGPSAEVLTRPTHPATRELLSHGE